MLLQKLSVAEADRVDSLRMQQYRRILRAFINLVNTARSPQSLREFRNLIQVGDHRGAMTLVDEHVAALGNVLPQAFVDVASQEVAAKAGKLRRPVIKMDDSILKAVLPKGQVAVGFDPSHERAAAMMRASKLRFVQQFTDSQRAATRRALASAFSGDVSVKEATRAFSNSIGLTDFQQQAVETYRKLLENSSGEALKRELRDRRYDPSVERAQATGSPLTDEQIDRMVGRYRSNFLRMRADMIARTESLRITSEAQQEALEQLLEQTGLDPNRVRRVWNATKDKRTRDSHAAMHGQMVGVDQPFISGLGNQLM